MSPRSRSSGAGRSIGGCVGGVRMGLLRQAVPWWDIRGSARIPDRGDAVAREHLGGLVGGRAEHRWRVAVDGDPADPVPVAGDARGVVAVT